MEKVLCLSTENSNLQETKLSFTSKIWKCQLNFSPEILSLAKKSLSLGKSLSFNWLEFSNKWGKNKLALNDGIF